MKTFTCYLSNGKTVKVEETTEWRASKKPESKYPDLETIYVKEGGDTDYIWDNDTKLWMPNPSYYPTVEDGDLIYGNYCSATPLLLSNGVEIPNVNIKRANKLFPEITELETDQYGDTQITIDVNEKALSAIDVWRDMHKRGLVHIVFIPLQFFYLFTSNTITATADDPFRIPCVLKNGKISTLKFYLPW